MSMRAGDWVEVRSKEEILRTLDGRGRLDGLPFMPQMFQYCGRRFLVFKRAHKTCNTIGAVAHPGRRLVDGIHLNLRCDGKAFGGCQAACLIFWKEQWLKPVEGRTGEVHTRPVAHHASSDIGAIADDGCSENDVWRASRATDGNAGGEPVYVCQATQLLDYTAPLPWWDLRQYWQDYTSGNASVWRILRGFIYVCYVTATFDSNRFGAPTRWLYDRLQTLWGGVPFPRRRGELPADQPAPTIDLNLKPGELVRVKSFAEIRKTIHDDNKNRGLAFDAELVPYCGRTYRVRARVEKFINETTGRLETLRTPAVILENVYCRARYTPCRMFCPRSIFSWWREIWLERVADPIEDMAADRHILLGSQAAAETSVQGQAGGAGSRGRQPEQGTARRPQSSDTTDSDRLNAP
jgi:hypothetical protein